jgi:hypothetical protein
MAGTTSLAVALLDLDREIGASIDVAVAVLLAVSIAAVDLRLPSTPPGDREGIDSGQREADQVQ